MAPKRKTADFDIKNVSEGERDGKRRCSVQKLSVGDRLSCSLEYIVKGISPDRKHVELHTAEEHPSVSHVASGIVEGEYFSSDQVLATQLVTQTQMEQVVRRAVDTVVTVTFNKMPKPSEKDLVGADLSTPTARRALIRRILDGEQRTIHGSITHVDDEGRAHIFDMGVFAEKKKRVVSMRQFYSNRVKSLVFKNVRYERK